MDRFGGRRTISPANGGGRMGPPDNRQGSQSPGAMQNVPPDSRLADGAMQQTANAYTAPRGTGPSLFDGPRGIAPYRFNLPPTSIAPLGGTVPGPSADPLFGASPDQSAGLQPGGPGWTGGMQPGGMMAPGQSAPPNFEDIVLKLIGAGGGVDRPAYSDRLSPMQAERTRLSDGYRRFLEQMGLALAGDGNRQVAPIQQNRLRFRP